MIGVIDCGGGTRGSYSAGIYDCLLDNNISLEYCIGISAGAANLVSYLAKQRGRNKKFYTDYLHRKDYMSASNILKNGSYLNLDYIYSTLSNSDGEDPVDYVTFSNSDSEYYVATTNARTGEPHYFPKRDMLKDNYHALKASCALPLVCKPQEIEGQYYYDGGLAEPIPYRKAFDDGCDQLIVILTRPRDYQRTMQKHLGILTVALKKYPETLRVIKERHIKYNNSLKELKKLEKEGQVLIVAPSSIAGMKTLSKDLAPIENLYTMGYVDSKKVIDFLQANSR